MAIKHHHQSRDFRAVEPIKNEADIDKIKFILLDKPRDLLLFELAIQTGIKMKKLLALRVKHLLGLEVGDRLSIATNTLGATHTVQMTKSIHRTFHRYLKEASLSADDYLFKSRRGQRPLNLSSVSNMIKDWFEAANIKGPYGARSLRKTWEYLRKSDFSASKGFSTKIDSMDVLEPIETFTVQEKIYERLFEAIVSCKISPGTKLTIGQISKRFGVSPTPVRIALTWLEARGFVTAQKKKACIVKDLTVKDLKEMAKIRLTLETLGVRESCKICSDETLTELEAIPPLYKQTTDLDKLQQINKKFHMTLYRDANMPMLQQMISDLCDKVSPYFIFLLSSMNDPQQHRETWLKVHTDILKAMKRRQPEEVSKLLEADLFQGAARIQKALEQREGRLLKGDFILGKLI